MKVKEIIPDEEKVLAIAHHPQQVFGFCFFSYCLVFQHNRTFYYGPFYTQNFQSFFYSLLFSLEGAKTVINYSRLSVFRTVAVCVLFRFTENMRSNHIFKVVYFHPIVKKKRFCYTVFSF